MGRIRKRTAELNLLLPGDPETRTGGYIYDRRIVQGLAGLGWQVRVHCLDSSFPRPTPDALRRVEYLLASFPAGSIVIIDGLALGGLENVLGAEAARLRLIALVHHPLALETGLDSETARLLRESERASLGLVRRVVVTSRWTARALGEYGVAGDRISVVEPGVDPVPAERRSRPANKPTTFFNLLCVGTLTPRKGHAVLIDALSLLRDRRWRLRCAGSLTRDPQTADAVRRQIDRLRLRSRITLAGEGDAKSLHRLYARCDLFVLASYMEGYGMVLADALAHGVAIVSTTAGAIPETVPPGACRLAPPGNARAFAEALAAVMDDPEVLRSLRENAMSSGKTLPTWEAAALKFGAVIADVDGGEP